MSCTTTNVITYIQNDTLPELECTYADSDDNPVDISGFSIELHIGYPVPKTVVGTITAATSGEFKFSYSSGDLDTVGQYPVEIQLTDAASKIITYQGLAFEIVPEIA